MSAKKSNDEIAREVLQGKWGNGAERQRRLKEAGYDYSEIQYKANQTLNSSNSNKSSEQNRIKSDINSYESEKANYSSDLNNYNVSLNYIKQLIDNLTEVKKKTNISKDYSKKFYVVNGISVEDKNFQEIIEEANDIQNKLKQLSKEVSNEIKKLEEKIRTLDSKISTLQRQYNNL